MGNGNCRSWVGGVWLRWLGGAGLRGGERSLDKLGTTGWAWLRPGGTRSVFRLRLHFPAIDSINLFFLSLDRSCGTLGDGGEPGGYLLGTAQVMHRYPVLDHQLLWEYLGRRSVLLSADVPLSRIIEHMFLAVKY